MTSQDMAFALAGGALIGCAAGILLWFNGRIAGIGGYCPGPVIAMFSLQWREPVIFVAAMLLGSFISRRIQGQG